MKKFNLIIKEEARNDIFDAYHWYESKQIGLGDRLIKIIENQFKHIIKNPSSFLIEIEQMRKLVIPKFPYVIIYEIEENNIFVYALFNTNQHPQKLNRRLPSE